MSTTKTSAEILRQEADKIGATVQTARGVNFMTLSKGDRFAEVWFTDTGKIARADTFLPRTRVQGRHFRRQILRWLDGA